MRQCPVPRPFRLLNSDAMTASWSRVTELVPGKVYQQGNVNDFIGMTGWKGSQVLYFGDHVFSDLAVSLVGCREESGPSAIFLFVSSLLGSVHPAQLEDWSHHPGIGGEDADSLNSKDSLSESWESLC